MKIRTSFVSNSSSSSFLILTTRDNHERALSQLTPEEREELDGCFCEDEFAGLKVVSISELNLMDSYKYISGKEWTRSLANAFENYRQQVNIEPNLVFEYDEQV